MTGARACRQVVVSQKEQCGRRVVLRETKHQQLAVGRKNRLLYRAFEISEFMELFACRGIPDVHAPLGVNRDEYLAVGTERQAPRYAAAVDAPKLVARRGVPNDNGALRRFGVTPFAPLLQTMASILPSGDSVGLPSASEGLILSTKDRRSLPVPASTTRMTLSPPSLLL